MNDNLSDELSHIPRPDRNPRFSMHHSDEIQNCLHVVRHFNRERKKIFVLSHKKSTNCRVLSRSRVAIVVQGGEALTNDTNHHFYSAFH